MNLIKNSNKTKRSGFTLIEMIGVLAIIAVLAGLLLPRIFGAINEARINSTAVGYNSAKAGAMGYFGKFGRFGDTNGVAYSTTTLATKQDWGLILLQTGFLDKPFTSKIGTVNEIQILSSVGSATAVDGSNAAYNFEGNTDNQATGGSAVIQIKLQDVALDDARALSLRVDGDLLSDTTTTGASDLKGKVKYNFGSAQSGDVLIYVAHK